MFLYYSENLVWISTPYTNSKHVLSSSSLCTVCICLPQPYCVLSESKCPPLPFCVLSKSTQNGGVREQMLSSPILCVRKHMLSSPILCVVRANSHPYCVLSESKMSSSPILCAFREQMPSLPILCASSSILCAVRAHTFLTHTVCCLPHTHCVQKFWTSWLICLVYYLLCMYTILYMQYVHYALPFLLHVYNAATLHKAFSTNNACLYYYKYILWLFFMHNVLKTLSHYCNIYIMM